MKYLKISSKGLLDIRFFSLIGGTTKDSDNTKIGHYGTGLKYAICFLLRNDIDFKIKLGNKNVNITSKIEYIRDEEFEIVYVNNKKTSLTTKMGGDAWGEWQVLRELYSNALDEGEAKVEIVEEVTGSKYRTAFYIECTPKILGVYNNWDKYFLVNKVPMYENSRFKLYPNSGTLKLYKQGVLIGEKTQYKSLFLYDFNHAYINELREYKGAFGADISKILYEIDDVNTIHYIIKNMSEEYYEGKEIDFKFWRSNTWQKPNEAWKEAFGNAKIITQKIKDKCESNNANIDLDNTVVVPENLYKGLNHHIEDISALRLADKINEFYEVIDPALEQKLKEAITILEEADYYMNSELKFIFGEFGKVKTLARINLDSKEIMISQKLKDKSLFDFCTMLVEENEHLRTGYSDETREFQQHFIDLYTKTLFDKADIKL